MEENYYPEGMLGSYIYESFQLLDQLEMIVLSGENEIFFENHVVFVTLVYSRIFFA